LVGDALFEVLIEFGKFLGLCSQLLGSLAKFAEQPLVLYGYYGLSREVLYQLNLLIRERPDFLAIERKVADRSLIFHHGDA
jgi:hypothetical protein